MNKKGQIRYNFGALDVISAILILIGIYLTQTNNQILGWVLVGVGILKQFSGK